MFLHTGTQAPTPTYDQSFVRSTLHSNPGLCKRRHHPLTCMFTHVHRVPSCVIVSRTHHQISAPVGFTPLRDIGGGSFALSGSGVVLPTRSVAGGYIVSQPAPLLHLPTLRCWCDSHCTQCQLAVVFWLQKLHPPMQHLPLTTQWRHHAWWWAHADE